MGSKPCNSEQPPATCDYDDVIPYCLLSPDYTQTLCVSPTIQY